RGCCRESCSRWPPPPASAPMPGAFCFSWRRCSATPCWQEPSSRIVQAWPGAGRAMPNSCGGCNRSRFGILLKRFSTTAAASSGSSTSSFSWRTCSLLFGKKTERYKGVGTSQQKSQLDEDSTDSGEPSNEKLSLEADVVDFDESLDDVTVDTPVSGRPKVMSVTIKDRKTLHAAYMPFLQSGGIFVPTTGKYKMGDEIFLLLKLVESPENVSIPGKVVWITPEGAMSHRVA